jgi:hypothetical protein
MIKDDLITKTDIPLLDLIYGEMKNRMYETEQALHETHEQNQQNYLEGLFDAYAFVYTEIDRIMYVRGKK